MDSVLVTAKVNPDLDGVSCALAYADLLKADGFVFEKPQAEVQYFIENHGIEIPVKSNDTNGVWDKYILVDSSSMKGMPKPVVPEKVVEVIDHRESHPEKEFPNAAIQNELIGAAATIIVERYISANKKMKKDYALLLFGAIFHNTLNFTSFNTNKRDSDAVRYLRDNFGLDEKVIDQMFDFTTRLILEDPILAIFEDAKQFGDKYETEAYQLVLGNDAIFNNLKAVEDAVFKVNKMRGAKQAILNVVDTKSKKSYIYGDSRDTVNAVSEFLGIKGRNGWFKLDKLLLRKQIMPRVREILDRNH